MTAKQVQEFKETEIGRIPVDWEVKKISEIAPTKNCVQTGPFGSLLHAHDYQEEGYPLILVKHVKDGKIIEDNLPKIGETKYSQLSKFILKAGDIVFTRVGYVGNTAYAENKHAGWLISGQMLRIRIDNPQINNRFVSYFFLTNKFKNIASSVVLGSTRDSINTQILKDIPIPIPSKKEQDKITSIIQSLIKKIQYLNDQNKILEQTAQAIFQSWFVDFVGQTEFEDSELGQIPKGWKVEKLADICTTQYGYTESASDEEIGPKFLRVTDMNKQAWINWNEVPYCKITETNFEKYSLKQGDIVVSRMADPGKAGMIEEDIKAVFASYLVRLKATSIEQSYFIFYFLRSRKYLDYAEGVSAGGSVQKNMNAKVITDVVLALSPDKILKSFFKLIYPIRINTVNNIHQINNLTKTRDALLLKLMSGEIRV